MWAILQKNVGEKDESGESSSFVQVSLDILMAQCPLSRNEICSPISAAHSMPSGLWFVSNSRCYWVLGILKQIILSWLPWGLLQKPLVLLRMGILWFLLQSWFTCNARCGHLKLGPSVDPLRVVLPLNGNCRLENTCVLEGGMHMLFGVMSHFVPKGFYW